MKLTAQQISQVKEQIGAEPLPPENPATEVLEQHFGEHTFYLDESGLHVFESPQAESEGPTCEVKNVKIATWADEKRDSLAPHDPEVGTTVLTVDSE